MQEAGVWKLAAHQARLDFAGLVATIDLRRPELGLTGIRFQGHILDSTSLLGVELPCRVVSPIADAYVRQRDLVVTYTQTPEVPFRVQIYWRAVSGPAGNPAIDLQVSVQTSLLDSSPRLTAATSFSDAERLRMAECAGGEERFPSHSYDLLRLAQREVSYVEMIYPEDRGTDSGIIADGGPSQIPTRVRVRHPLFASFLEKGVILRARLRGVFLPRNRDTELAAEAYRQFLNAPPPLTT